MSKVIVIGAGPAGMYAAISAAKNGHTVTLIEKNDKLGKKLFITGKGRCNITNAGDMDNLFESVVTNRKFLYSAFYAMDNNRVIEFFEEYGVKTKIERGNRVFPVSDHSSDVILALQKALKKHEVCIKLKTQATKILTKEGQVYGVILSDFSTLEADAVIVSTGGFSYQATGSTGDGYKFAEETGHKVTEILPSLVPFTVKEDYILAMQGLALKNVSVRIKDKNKLLYEEFGELLFTHFGVSGPLMLSASSFVGKKIKEHNLALEIDLKPALSFEQLDQRIIRDFKENMNKQFKNAFSHLLPAKMLPVVLELSGISLEKKINEITKEERTQLVRILKAFPATLTGFRDFNEAIITKGGVSVKEINPSTMESKKIKNLFFAGEVLDLDALTGGYNLQIAWSTGYLAGNSVK